MSEMFTDRLRTVQRMVRPLSRLRIRWLWMRKQLRVAWYYMKRAFSRPQFIVFPGVRERPISDLSSEPRDMPFI